jgi:hypothetical protein
VVIAGAIAVTPTTAMTRSRHQDPRNRHAPATSCIIRPMTPTPYSSVALMPARIRTPGFESHFRLWAGSSPSEADMDRLQRWRDDLDVEISLEALASPARDKRISAAWIPTELHSEDDCQHECDGGDRRRDKQHHPDQHWRFGLVLVSAISGQHAKLPIHSERRP